MRLRRDKEKSKEKNKVKQLKKLKREELLELLLEQTKRAEELEAQLEKAKEALNNKEIAILEAGSIAEASLRINKIFEAAQAAADQYLENVKNPNKNNNSAETEKEA